MGYFIDIFQFLEKVSQSLSFFSWVLCLSFIFLTPVLKQKACFIWSKRNPCLKYPKTIKGKFTGEDLCKPYVHTCEYLDFKKGSHSRLLRVFWFLKPILSAFYIVPNHTTGVSNLLSGMHTWRVRFGITLDCLAQIKPYWLPIVFPNGRERKYIMFSLWSLQTSFLSQ